MKKWPVRPPLAWHQKTSRPQSKGLERDGSAVKGTCCSYRKKEGPGLVPSTGMAAHNCLHSSSIHPLLSSTHVVYRHACMQVTYILKELKTFLFSIPSQKLFNKTQVEENRFLWGNSFTITRLTHSTCRVSSARDPFPYSFYITSPNFSNMQAAVWKAKELVNTWNRDLLHFIPSGILTHLIS